MRPSGYLPLRNQVSLPYDPGLSPATESMSSRWERTTRRRYAPIFRSSSLATASRRARVPSGAMKTICSVITLGTYLSSEIHSTTLEDRGQPAPRSTPTGTDTNHFVCWCGAGVGLVSVLVPPWCRSDLGLKETGVGLV